MTDARLAEESLQQRQELVKAGQDGQVSTPGYDVHGGVAQKGRHQAGVDQGMCRLAT